MKTLQARLITTHLCLDNTKFSKGALEKLVKQINEGEGVLPFNMCHDNTRPIGMVIRGSAELAELEDGEFAVDAKVGIFENQKEFDDSGVKVRITATEKEVGGEEVVELKEDINNPTYVLKNKNTSEFLGFELNEEDMLEVSNPSIINQKGIQVDEENIVLYDHFFRRYYKLPNTFSLRLFDYAKDLLNKDENLKFSVRLDKKRFSLLSEYSPYGEYDYSWGPNLPVNLNELQEGVTKYESSQAVQNRENILDVDFWWHKKSENIMTLEIEERILPEYTFVHEDYGEGVLLRYCHLEFNKETGKVVHLDFAIRFYTPKNYIENRFLGDISKVGKESERRKMLRIDGELEPKEAFNLISLYYHNNEDVKEYFSKK